MRRKDREMDKEFAYTVLDAAPYVTLAMAEKGLPYCIPISPARSEDSLYFHCALEGLKNDLLSAQPKVCISAVSYVRPVEGKFTTEFSSAVAFGTARFITDDAEKIKALRLICEKYTPDNMPNFDAAISASLGRTGVVRIDLDSVTGKQKKIKK